MNKHYNPLTKLLLVGTLLFAQNVNAENISLPIKDNLPKRILYLNENNQIFLVVGNEDASYKEIKIFRGKEEVKMNPEIDYQYQRIKPKLDFNRGMCIVAPVAVPKTLLKLDGKSYSKLEKEVINKLYEKNILYSGNQITKALKKSNIASLVEGDKWYVTVYSEESKNGYEEISLERIK